MITIQAFAVWMFAAFVWGIFAGMVIIARLDDKFTGRGD